MSDGGLMLQSLVEVLIVRIPPYVTGFLRKPRVRDEGTPSFGIFRDNMILAKPIFMDLLSPSRLSVSNQSSRIVLPCKRFQHDNLQSKVFDFKHVQPIHHHHSLDQVSSQINMPEWP